MKKNFKKIAKQLLLIVFGVLVVSVSVKATTTIGNNIITKGLNVNSLVGETELRVDGTNSASSSAIIMATGETSRLNFMSGEALWPTTWSLGINTGLDLSPNQDFQIRQTADGSGLVDEARLTILKSNGNIGIGTTTPEYKLDINGDINIASSSSYMINGVSVFKNDYLDNLFLGGNAGYSATSLTSGSNVFVGGSSGYSCNGSSCGGNTFLGAGSGYSVSSGQNNSFIGYNAGRQSVDGYRNIFIGTASGYSNINGYGNIFIGFGAGYEEVGSNKLYISNSETTATSSLIYGEFDNNILSFNASVGIGTTTPSEKLVVIGSSIFEGLARFSDTVNITNQTNQSDDVSLTLDSLFTTLASSSARITLRGATSRLTISSAEALWPTAWSLGINASQEEVPSQDFQIFQDTDGAGVVNKARLTILKSNGNIGIGTSTPESKLHVYSGDANATSTIQIGDESASKGSCLKLRDSDGLGWTYCSTLDGTLSCSTTSCN